MEQCLVPLFTSYCFFVDHEKKAIELSPISLSFYFSVSECLDRGSVFSAPYKIQPTTLLDVPCFYLGRVDGIKKSKGPALLVKFFKNGLVLCNALIIFIS